MKHKLIKTDNYLLVVDESEIREGLVLTNLMEIVVFNKPSTPSLYKKIISHLPINKIIAHLPINAPILKGVPLLPPLEDDGDLIYENTEDSFYKKYDDALHYYSFIVGYNKAKEKYKYTEEDLRIAIQQAFLSGLERLEDFGKVESMIIGNIQQPKYPVAFECEIEVCVFGNHTNYDPKIEDYVKPKTTTNSQGQTQLVGTYIYE